MILSGTTYSFGRQYRILVTLGWKVLHCISPAVAGTELSLPVSLRMAWATAGSLLEGITLPATSRCLALCYLRCLQGAVKLALCIHHIFEVADRKMLYRIISWTPCAQQLPKPFTLNWKSRHMSGQDGIDFR